VSINAEFQPFQIFPFPIAAIKDEQVAGYNETIQLGFTPEELAELYWGVKIVDTNIRLKANYTQGTNTGSIDYFIYWSGPLNWYYIKKKGEELGNKTVLDMTPCKDRAECLNSYFSAQVAGGKYKIDQDFDYERIVNKFLILNVTYTNTSSVTGASRTYSGKVAMNPFTGAVFYRENIPTYSTPILLKDLTGVYQFTSVAQSKKIQEAKDGELYFYQTFKPILGIGFPVFGAHPQAGDYFSPYFSVFKNQTTPQDLPINYFGRVLKLYGPSTIATQLQYTDISLNGGFEIKESFPREAEVPQAVIS